MKFFLKNQSHPSKTNIKTNNEIHANILTPYPLELKSQQMEWHVVWPCIRMELSLSHSKRLHLEDSLLNSELAIVSFYLLLFFFSSSSTPSPFPSWPSCHCQPFFLISPFSFFPSFTLLFLGLSPRCWCWCFPPPPPPSCDSAFFSYCSLEPFLIPNQYYS